MTSKTHWNKFNVPVIEQSKQMSERKIEMKIKIKAEREEKQIQNKGEKSEKAEEKP